MTAVIILSTLLLSSLTAGLFFAVRYFMLKNELVRLSERIAFISQTETNIGLDVGMNTRYIKKLVKELNSAVVLLKETRRDYIVRDRELKEAVSNISHDLRTPLTVISGYAERLLKDAENPKTLKNLQIIIERTEYMKSLIEELFSYSAAVSDDKPAELKELSLNSALEDTLAQFYNEIADKGITPVLNIAEKEIIRKLNRQYLQRILGNIISNALHHGGKDLDVCLTDEGELRFTNSADNIDAVTVAKLFDRFFTVQNARYYGGLGLSIAKLLAERMGGTITAEYNDGRLTVILRFNC